MAKIKLNLKDLSVNDLVAKARQIGSALKTNPNFPTPQPTVAQIEAAADDLEASQAAAHAARQDAQMKTSIAHEKTDSLMGLLRQVAGYVESVAGDDETKILSAGMTMKSTATTPSTVFAPTGLSATAGEHEGEIDLSWDRTKGARSYVIERSPDPLTQTSWVHQGVALKSAATINGLTSGARYWFRVAAVSNNGQSGWSDPTVKMAP